MLCAICYHLYNLKNKKNTHGGVFPLVKLQVLVEAWNFTKSNTPPWVFFNVFKIVQMVPNHAKDHIVAYQKNVLTLFSFHLFFTYNFFYFEVKASLALQSSD